MLSHCMKGIFVLFVFIRSPHHMQFFWQTLKVHLCDILRFSGKRFSQLVIEILNDAFVRASLKKHAYVRAANNARA